MDVETPTRTTSDLHPFLIRLDRDLVRRLKQAAIDRSTPDHVASVTEVIREVLDRAYPAT